MNSVMRFWALPSGQIAYSLVDPTVQALQTWSRSGPVGRVKDIDPGPGFAFASVLGMNSKGVLLCLAYGSTAKASRGTADRRAVPAEQPFLIDHSRRITLAGPGSSLQGASPLALNDAGKVIGIVRKSPQEWVGCVWTNGKPETIPPINGQSVYPVAINGRGELLVSYSSPDHKKRYYAVRSGHSTRPIDTSNWQIVSLSSINSHLDVAGMAMKSPNPSQWAYHAVVIRKGVLSDLGALNGATMEVRALSDQGVIAGTARPIVSPETGPRAFIWDQKYGLRDLNTLLPSASGWTLREAHGIDANGAIYGTGVHDGQPRFFRLTLPAGG
jgi:hypothetical protein